MKLLDVKKSLKIRNLRDVSRKNSPLLKSPDAIIVDTGKLKISEMVAKLSKIIESKIKKKYGS
ncbi:MAG: (d)CMP kinase [Pelagibacteraceae bacterium]